MTAPLQFYAVADGDKIITLWPQILPLINKAISIYQEHCSDEILTSLLSAQRQLWVSGNSTIEAVLITQIIVTKDGKTCFLELCAGRGSDSIKFLKWVEKWAQSIGCSSMELSGRHGWQRKLKDYHIKKIILIKEL